MVKKEEKKKEKSMEGLAYGIQVQLAKAKNDYITDLINGRYFLARSNMMVEQLISKKIVEKIDGCPKSEDLMRQEHVLMKMQAIKSMRNAHFAKEELMGKNFKLTKKDIVAIEEDYYEGKVIREEYDEGYKQRGKAEFVDPSKN